MSERDIPTQMVGQGPHRGGLLPGDPHALVGTVLDGRYRIVRPIAGGSTGHVYEARQDPLDREVAVKLLRLDRPDDPRFEKRFQREASLAAQLAHPNIVTIYDYGKTEDGHVYMVMEHLRGVSLDRRLRDEGRFELRRALHVAIQIARALRKAHERGVVHRDLKPSNIMVQPGEDNLDFIKVLDFGLVKLFEPSHGAGPQMVFGERLTTVGAMLGTPGYMSPEQAMGEEVDARTDVYACGVILYALLAGKLPFDGSTVPELISQQVMRPVRRIPSLANSSSEAEVDQLLRDCLHRDREQRPATADALLGRLKTIWRFENDDSYGTEASIASPLRAVRVFDPGPEAIVERAPAQEPTPLAAPEPRSRWLGVMAALACALAAAAVYVALDTPPPLRAKAPEAGPSAATLEPPPARVEAPVTSEPTAADETLAPLPEGDAEPTTPASYKENPY